MDCRWATLARLAMLSSMLHRGAALPTIAYFLGIAVRMFFNDHDPPHVHAHYQGYRARVRISDGTVIDGRLPPTATVARMSVVKSGDGSFGSAPALRCTPCGLRLL
ncbi:MAG: DUF4160 domain-containing protein [Rhodoplanes sp.]